MSRKINYLIENYKEQIWGYAFVGFLSIITLFFILGYISFFLFLKVLFLFLLIGAACIVYLYPQILLYILIITESADLPGWMTIYYDQFVAHSSIGPFIVYPEDLIISFLTIIVILKRVIPLKQEIIRKRNLEHLALLYVLLVGPLAIIIGALRGNHNLFYAYRLQFYFLLAVTIPVIIDSTVKLYRTVKFFIVVHGIAMSYAFINNYILANFKFGYIIYARFINLFVVLILFALIFKKRKDWFQKFAVYGMLPLFILVLLIDHGRTYYLGLIIGTVLITLVNFKLKRKFPILPLLIFGVLILIAITGFNISSNIQERASTAFNIESDVSILYRLTAMETTLKAMKNPISAILGSGNGTWLNFYRPDKISRGRPTFGTWTLHNFHLKLLLISGLVGYLFFIYLLFTLSRKGWLTYKKEEGLLKHLSLGFLVGFISYIIIIYFTVFNVPQFVKLWFFGGLVLATYNIHLRRVRQSRSL